MHRSHAHSAFRFVPALLLAAAALAIASCGTMGTKLQPPAASIQQLTANSDGTWSVVVRFQNNSYDTGMRLMAIDAAFTLNGKPVGQLAFSPALGIPAMDADISSTTLKPDAAGAAALKAAGHNAIAYQLKGTLSAGKDPKGSAQSFPLDAKGYISPVPGVSNIWR